MFESYLAPADGVTPPRDLASFEVWEISLQRSLRRRALAEQHRRAAPRTKTAATAVTAALLVTPVLGFASASAGVGSGARSAQSQPLVRSLQGRVLERGATGRIVAQVQRLLGVEADGIFGPVTARAVRSFQRGAGLAATGKVDARTRSALLQSPAATAPKPSAAPCSATLRSPVRGTRAGGFGDGRGHDGVDVLAPVGTPVRAAACGTVAFAGTESGYGKLVCVQHSPTFSTCYAHLQQIARGKGSKVAAGQVIGRVGMTGRTSGAHLHFETRVDGQAVDPAPYLAGTRAVPGLAAAPAPPAVPAAPAAPAPPAAPAAPAPPAAPAASAPPAAPAVPVAPAAG